MWGAHKADGRIAAKNSVKVRAAIRQSINAKQIAEAYQQTHPFVTDNHALDRNRARAWAMLHVAIDKEPIKAALLRVYADGYILGQDAASEALNMAIKKRNKVAGITKEVGTEINWATWTPGDRASALLLNPTGAFQRLLDNAGIVSNSIAKAGYDRIGTALADGIAAGFSPARTARIITDKIGDPARALTIAITEQNRAMSIAAMNRYREAGVEKVEWATANPCDICAPNEGQVVALGDNFESGDTEPPVHPNCRCALLPVIAGMEDAPLDGDFTDMLNTGASNPAISEPATQTWGEIDNGKWVQRKEAERLSRGKAPLNSAELRVAQQQATDTIKMWERGPHLVRWDKTAADIDEKYVLQFIKNFDTALAKLPAWRRFDEKGIERPYAAIISNEARGGTLAYTYTGGNTIWFSNSSVKSSLDKSPASKGLPLSNFKMPARHEVNSNLYTISHELGHTVDSRENAMIRGRFAGALKRKYGNLFSEYGRKDSEEGYAEAYAQWALGKESALTKAYADKFGWDLTVQEYKDQIVTQWKPNTRTLGG